MPYFTDDCRQLDRRHFGMTIWQSGTSSWQTGILSSWQTGTDLAFGTTIRQTGATTWHFGATIRQTGATTWHFDATIRQTGATTWHFGAAIWPHHFATDLTWYSSVARESSLAHGQIKICDEAIIMFINYVTKNSVSRKCQKCLFSAG